MTTAREQVLELVSSGKISAAEGDELLKALPTERRSSWKVLINPFDRLNAGWAFGLSVVGATVGLMLSRWNIRFDGALDVHVAPHAVAWREALVDQVVAWPLTAFVLWSISLAFARQGRLVDFLGNVGTARLPLLLVGVVAGAMRGQLPTAPSDMGVPPSIMMLFLVAATVPAVVLAVAMLFQGYRTASGLSGVKCALSFTAAVIAAEVLSKVALGFINLFGQFIKQGRSGPA